ncbi:hypothetical protein BC830DRAFT_506779 [Chytriomyces sp. MP71]|nr:hypothetical protein BC830DRAFT_506779 [Chytriomyces sp. MP71]
MCLTSAGTLQQCTGDRMASTGTGGSSSLRDRPSGCFFRGFQPIGGWILVSQKLATNQKHEHLCRLHAPHSHCRDLRVPWIADLAVVPSSLAATRDGEVPAQRQQIQASAVRVRRRRRDRGATVYRKRTGTCIHCAYKRGERRLEGRGFLYVAYVHLLSLTNLIAFHDREQDLAR